MNENAFAFIVQARPGPTFGRPVHRRGSPHRLRPGTSPHTLRIPPHDGHPVLRSDAESGSRSTLAVSGFRFRARLGFSIPLPFSGQRGITPAFGYSAPHPDAGGTSTLLNNALLSAHYTPGRPAAKGCGTVERTKCAMDSGRECFRDTLPGKGRTRKAGSYAVVQDSRSTLLGLLAATKWKWP